MANLQEILGEKYRKDMTFEEIDAAMAEVNPFSGYIEKGKYDRLSSELADAKKQIKSKMTEDEQHKAQEEERMRGLETELATLRKEKTISDTRANLLTIGYSDDLAGKCAEAFANGDTAQIIAFQKQHLQEKEKAIRAELLRDTPRPGASGTGTGDTNYQNEIEKAISSGDTAAAAYYTRLAGQSQNDAD